MRILELSIDNVPKQRVSLPVDGIPLDVVNRNGDIFLVWGAIENEPFGQYQVEIAGGEDEIRGDEVFHPAAYTGSATYIGHFNLIVDVKMNKETSYVFVRRLY